MPRKKSKPDRAAGEVADILIGHMEETMAPAEAQTTLGDLKTFAKGIVIRKSRC
jgi:hypothetical protein